MKRRFVLPTIALAILLMAGSLTDVQAQSTSFVVTSVATIAAAVRQDLLTGELAFKI